MLSEKGSFNKKSNINQTINKLIIKNIILNVG